MAGTTRTSRTSTAKASAAPKEDPKVKELEAKVAKLEASIAALEKSLSALQSAPAPAPVAAASSKDEELRHQLQRYFKTLGNAKIPTHIPNLD